MTSTSQTLRFRPRSRVIRALGDRLISGPLAALIELVKNGYDADADRVTVSFLPGKAADEIQISVADTGHGMSMQDIGSHWMEPATSNKLERRLSPGKRVMLGSKGIGRFAAARLGDRLVLASSHRTTRRSPIETTEVELDWSKFESGYLDEVRLVLRRKPSAKSTGTLLTISKLRDSWGSKLIQEAVRELRRLMAPIGMGTDSDFKVFLDVSALIVATGVDADRFLPMFTGAELRKGPVEIQPFPLLNFADYEVMGSFSADGQFRGSMVFNRDKKGTMQPLDFSVPLRPGVGEEPCGEVTVNLQIFDREEMSLKALARRAGRKDWRPQDVRKTLDEVSGIAIYRTGFRIRPYGDNDQDWLTLDRRRVQDPSRHIGHNQVIGTLQVEDAESSGLEEKSSREGLEQNGAYFRLQTLIRELLDREVEAHRYAFRDKLGLGRKKSRGFSKAYETANFEWATALLKELPPAKRSAARKRVEKASAELVSTLSDLEDRQARMEAHASLGLIVAEVLHEGRPPVAYLITKSKRLAGGWKGLFDTTASALAKRSEAEAFVPRMKEEALRLERLFRLLVPLSGRRRGSPRNFDVDKIIAEAIEVLAPRISEFKVSVKFESDERCMANGYRDDLHAAMTNLLDNSLFWLNHLNVRHPEIRVGTNVSRGHIEITIEDNGPGIKEDFLPQLFEPGFTTKPGGTGLGLSIAREALRRSGGAIQHVPSAVGCKFKIRLSGVES